MIGIKSTLRKVLSLLKPKIVRQGELSRWGRFELGNDEYLNEPESSGGGGDSPQSNCLDISGLKAHAGAEELGETQT